MKLFISPRRVALAMAIIIALLLLGHLVGLFFTYALDHPYVFGFVPLFDLDEENNIPTLYASTTLLLSASLFSLIAFLVRREGERGYAWICLGCVFAFLALDEYASLHEGLIDPLQAQWQTSGLFYFAWIIPYGIGVFVLALAFSRWFITLPCRTRALMISAGMLYVGGVLVMEAIGGYYTYEHGRFNLTFDIFATIEEVLEMAGVLVLIYALLDYISNRFGGLFLAVGEQE